MPCSLDRKFKVRRLVLDYFRRRSEDDSLGEDTKVSSLLLDEQAKDSYHRGIAKKISDEGCSMRGFTPTQFKSKKTLGEIIDAAWEAVAENDKTPAKA